MMSRITTYSLFTFAIIANIHCPWQDDSYHLSTSGFDPVISIINAILHMSYLGKHTKASCLSGHPERVTNFLSNFVHFKFSYMSATIYANILYWTPNSQLQPASHPILFHMKKKICLFLQQLMMALSPPVQYRHIFRICSEF